MPTVGRISITALVMATASLSSIGSPGPLERKRESQPWLRTSFAVAVLGRSVTATLRLYSSAMMELLMPKSTKAKRRMGEAGVGTEEGGSTKVSLTDTPSMRLRSVMVGKEQRVSSALAFCFAVRLVCSPRSNRALQEPLRRRCSVRALVSMPCIPQTPFYFMKASKETLSKGRGPSYNDRIIRAAAGTSMGQSVLSEKSGSHQ